MLIFVFDHHASPDAANHVLRRAENPYAWLNSEHIDAFAGTEREDVGGSRRRYGIAIEGKHLKSYRASRSCDYGARIQQMEENAIPAHARIGSTEIPSALSLIEKHLSDVASSPFGRVSSTAGFSGCRTDPAHLLSISAFVEKRLPIADCEENLLIVVARIFAESTTREIQTAPCPVHEMEIVIRHCVAVIQRVPAAGE